MEWTKKIIQVGNSSGALLIPSEVLEYMNLKIDDDVTLKVYEKTKGKYVSFWKKE